MSSDAGDEVRPARAARPGDPSPDAVPSPGPGAAAGGAGRVVGGRDLPVAIAVGVVLAGVFLGSIFWHPLAFTVVVSSFVVIACVEAAAQLRRVGLHTGVPAMIIGGLVTVFGAYRSQHAGQAAGVLVLFLGAVLWLLADPERRDVVRNLTMTVWLGIWTGFLGSFGVLLVNRPEDGPVAVLAVIGAAIFGDIGGYAAGVRFGRHKLAPTVSPNKTVEGLVGGLLTSSVLAAVVLPVVGELFTPVTAVVVAVVCVLAGMLGDLAESMVKRDLGIKDFGNILPGHGGILDRVDGILMAMPVGFFAIAILT